MTTSQNTRRHKGRARSCNYRRVAALWKKLRNQDKVAEHFGISQTQVCRILHGQGIRPGRGARKPIVQLPSRQIVSMYQRGLSCREIADKFSTRDEVVRKRLRKLGVVRRERGQYERRGQRNAQWKGGRSKQRQKDKDMHFFRRQAYEVSAICLGQPLPRGWVIHHIDENWRNNNPSNLLLFPSQSRHCRYHQLLLSLQLSGKPVDAIQLALENDGRLLPKPPRPIELGHDTNLPFPSGKSGLLSCDRTALQQRERKRLGLRPASRKS